MRSFFSIIALLTSLISGWGQNNLVPNAGFEELFTCPSHLGQFNGVVKNWKTPTHGTPNYYHACASQPEVGVPFNYFGYKKALQGAAYSGIMTSNAFREYITIELKASLKTGITYRLQFYTSVILNSSCTSKGLDILFSPQPPYSDQPGTNLTVPATLTIPINYPDESWVRSQVCFQAMGGERYLTVGDLQYPQAHHDCGDGEISYYFIDSIKLEEIIPNSPREIIVTTCPLTFPMVLDGKTLTRLNSTADPVAWIWQDSIHAPRLTINQAGKYRLTVNYPNCISDDYIIHTGDQDCLTSIFAPNIFTPDGDGINDHFEIHHKGILWERLTIYNRYGEPVFSASDPGLSWDGYTVGGSPSPPGVYVYLLRYKIIATGKMAQKSGSVTLIR